MNEPYCDAGQRSGGHLPCPACGRPGKRVPEETPAALVRTEAAGQVADGVPYRFCATPGCAVAYYPETAGAAPPIEVGALRVPVGQKGMGDPRPLCYCFGFSEVDVRARAAAGDERVSAVVKRRMQDPGCACATQNPSGHCCLGDIRAAERRLAGAPDRTEPPSPAACLPDRQAPMARVAGATGSYLDLGTSPAARSWGRSRIPSATPAQRAGRTVDGDGLRPQGARRGGLAGLLAVVPGIGAALLPAVACSACWPAYAGLLSSFGVGFVNYTSFLLPIMALFLAVALATLAVQGRRRGHYGPLLLGAAGTAGLLAGRFAVASDPLMYAGITALIVASAWNTWPRRGAACGVAAGRACCGWTK